MNSVSSRKKEVKKGSMRLGKKVRKMLTTSASSANPDSMNILVVEQGRFSGSVQGAGGREHHGVAQRRCKWKPQTRPAFGLGYPSYVQLKARLLPT